MVIEHMFESYVQPPTNVNPHHQISFTANQRQTRRGFGHKSALILLTPPTGQAVLLTGLMLAALLTSKLVGPARRPNVH
jgi:hypothetical protein